MVVALVRNTKSRDAMTNGEPSYVPQIIKMICGSSHGPAIHMSKKRSTGSKSRLGGTELLIDGRTRRIQGTKLEVESMESTSARINTVNASIEKSHVGRRKSS
jgi:hypothetical protein